MLTTEPNDIIENDRLVRLLNDMKYLSYFRLNEMHRTLVDCFLMRFPS